MLPQGLGDLVPTNHTKPRHYVCPCILVWLQAHAYASLLTNSTVVELLSACMCALKYIYSSSTPIARA